MDEFEQAYARAVIAAGPWGGAGETAEAGAAVDAAASVLAAAGDGWDEVAARLAARVVRECRARGWQPADLVRMAGRELTPAHQELAVAIGDGSAADPLTAFSRTQRSYRFEVATTAVELLCLYGRLPRITALTGPGPGPSSAPGPGPAAAPTRAASKMLGRIRALLAKAESTAFPEEAEALSAKAQHLMTRHSIDEALLAAHGSGVGGPGGPGARRIGVDRPYEGAKALLLDAVASANRCQAVWSGDFGFSTVVGYEADLDAVELLYTSLLVQADHALSRGGAAASGTAGPGTARSRKSSAGGKAPGTAPASRSRDFRESFLIAYASRVRQRLASATEAEVGESARSAADLLPALAARDLAVHTTTRRLFPATTTSRLKGRDAEGWRHGQSAADRARL